MPRGQPEVTCGDHGGRRPDGRPCGRAEGWGTDFDEGRCRDCLGKAPDGSTDGHGAPEGNGNAVTHSAHRKPEFLKSDIVDTPHEDTFHATHEALCDRYEQFHGWLDAAIRKDLEEIALMYVKRDLIDVHARDHAAEDSPLVEEHIIGVDDDGRPVEVADVNKLQGLWTDLRRESRLLLKDMGLYHDPESQQANATGDLAAVLERINK